MKIDNIRLGTIRIAKFYSDSADKTPEDEQVLEDAVSSVVAVRHQMERDGEENKVVDELDQSRYYLAVGIVLIATSGASALFTMVAFLLLIHGKISIDTAFSLYIIAFFFLFVCGDRYYQIGKRKAKNFDRDVVTGIHRAIVKMRLENDK